MSPATYAIIAAIAGSSGLGVIVAKYFRPNATPLELLSEVRKDREEDRLEIDDLKKDNVVLKSDMREVVDYVHALRQHIADGKPPPPPPWPEGLRS